MATNIYNKISMQINVFFKKMKISTIVLISTYAQYYSYIELVFMFNG
jgi:hypothetical protein